jgi:hypothetical protein
MERKAMVETTICVNDENHDTCGGSCVWLKFDHSDEFWTCKLFHHRLRRADSVGGIEFRQRCQECLKHFGQ